MEIEFATHELIRLYTGDYSGKQSFSEDILRRFRNKVVFMLEAESLNELSKIRSLNIEKYKDRWSARINDQYRIEFEYIKPNTIYILKISKHYEK